MTRPDFTDGFPPEIQKMIADALISSYQQGQASIIDALRIAKSGANQAQFKESVYKHWALFGMDHMIASAELIHLETVFHSNDEGYPDV